MDCIFEVSGNTPADANKHTNELYELIHSTIPIIDIKRRKESTDSQDIGTIIQVIVDSGATIALAKGVASWLAKRTSGSLTIKRPDGSIIVKGVTSGDAVKLVELLTQAWK